jgi:NTP pyrophosphatase (non-canonical NTP hydrolase)
VNLDEYQQQAATTAIYPGQGDTPGLTYTCLGLAGEAGEVANKMQKVLRDHDGQVPDALLAGMLSELGGVLWYAAMLATELGWSLGKVAEANLVQLRDRQRRGVLGGRGDQR